MAKETYKRGLSIWQKRPTKEAYLYGKRDLHDADRGHEKVGDVKVDEIHPLFS